MKNKFYLSILFCLFFGNGFGQYEIEWQRTLGGIDRDNFKTINQTLDGGYIIGGTSLSDSSGNKTVKTKGNDDYWIVKLDSQGNIEWQQAYGGAGFDELACITQTADGGYFAVGFSGSGISGDKTDSVYGIWLLRLNTQGAISWQKTIHSLASIAVKVDQTSDGGYILGCNSRAPIGGDKTEDSIGGHDFWILKLDTSGTIEWQNVIGGTDEDELTAISQTTDNGFIVSGRSSSGISGDKNESFIGSYDFWILKLDAFGNIVWQNTIGGNRYDVNPQVKQTPDGGFIVGGASDSNISGDKTENTTSGASDNDFDYWILKLDSVGNIMWQNTVGGSLRDFLEEIKLSSNGGCFLTGTSMSDVSGDKNEDCRFYSDMWLIEIDSSGNLIWQKTIGGDLEERSSKLSITNDGGIILGCESSSGISGEKSEGVFSGNFSHWFDYWIVKLTPASTIMGKCFYDFNFNQIQDSNESVKVGAKIIENASGKYSFTQSDGSYRISEADTGTYNIQPLLINYFSSNPVSHTVIINAIKQVDSLNDFALQPNVSLTDLAVTIHPLSPFRSGLSAFYNLHYKNLGTTVVAPNIVFYLDSNITFVSASPAPTYVSQDSIVWNLGNISPSFEGDIDIRVSVNSGVFIGDLINSHAEIGPINGDSFPQNNIAYWEVYCTGSFDPNLIEVNRDTLLNSELLSPPYLEYVIYFQNTGNDTAFSIRIENIIPDDLDLNSFEFVSSSHPVNINLLQGSRLFSFSFPGILLVDSNTNEVESHGYIRYKIKPEKTLLLGNVIENHASIYFDYNSPVKTNYAQTQIVFPVKYFNTAITGNQVLCLDSNSTFNYAIVPHAGNTYLWEATDGIIKSGQGTNSVDIQWLIPGTHFVSVSECDSSLYLCDYDSKEIIVNQVFSTNQTIHMCKGDSVFIGGAWQKKKGIYVDTLTTSNGCDSLLVTKLTIRQSYNYYSSLSICNGDSAFLAGVWQTTAGIYTENFQTVFGCDSNFNTQLTVNPTYSSSYNISICNGDSIFLSGSWQTQQGNYTDNFQTTFGCDSIIETALSINPVFASTDTINIFQGDSVFVGGAWQTVAGVYIDNFLSQNGCDSVVTTVLNILTGINSMSNSEFIRIKPNPSSGFVTIGFSLIAKPAAQLTISNLQGQLILNDEIKSNQPKQLNISSFANGIYILKITCDGKNYYSKLVKE